MNPRPLEGLYFSLDTVAVQEPCLCACCRATAKDAHTIAEALAAPVAVPLSPGVWFCWRVPRGSPEVRACSMETWRQTHGMPSRRPSRHTVHTVTPSQWPLQGHVSVTQDSSCQSQLVSWTAPSSSGPPAVALMFSVHPATWNTQKSPKTIVTVTVSS